MNLYPCVAVPSLVTALYGAAARSQVNTLALAENQIGGRREESAPVTAASYAHKDSHAHKSKRGSYAGKRYDGSNGCVGRILRGHMYVS